MKQHTRHLINGLLFTSPFILGFLAFTLYPLVASFYYSFTDYKILTAPKWVGAENYADLLFRDDLFWTSLYNTAYYTVLALPLGLVFSFALALALNVHVRGMAVYRTVFYLPTILPAVALSILWLWMFHSQYGVINFLLSVVGVEGPGWFADPAWSKPALVIMHLWGVGNTMIIFLAGIQEVPKHLYEAAEIDGATWLGKIRYITVPMMTPIILFNLIIGLIGSFQYFTQAYVITNGGPLNSTLFYALYLYRQAFQYVRMGYASTLAWILFVLILIATLIIMRSSGRWVYYGGGR